MITTDTIHKKFEYYFGNEYKRKDLHKNCQFILKQLGEPIKNPVDGVKKNWSRVCQFLINWQGAPIRKTEKAKTKTKFEKFLKENFIYNEDSGFWYHKDGMTKHGSEPYNKSDIEELFKQREVTKDNITKEQQLMFEGKICPYCKKPTE